MQIVEFNKKKWVIDLEWEILPDEGEISRKEALKQITSKNNCNYGVFIDYDNQEAVGLAKKNVKVPSASLYLALANQELRLSSSEVLSFPDWIVVEDAGDEKYWLAVIKNGIPSPQSDKILDITKIKDTIADLIQVNDTYLMFSPCGEIQSIFEDLKIVEDKGVNALTEGIVYKNKFVKLRGIPNSLVYIGLGVIVLASIGIGVSSFLESAAMQERIAEQQRLEQEAAQQQEAEYQAKLKIYEQEVQALKAQAEDSVVLGLAGAPNKILNAWYQAVGDIKMGTHGWTMEGIDCQFTPINPAQKSNCVLHFARTGLSTNRMLLQDYPDAVINGDKADVNRKVIANEEIFLTPNKSILNTLPNAKNWGFDMISQLQLLKIANIDHKIEASADIVITPPAKPLSPQEIANNVKAVPPAPQSIGIAQGTLNIRGDNFELLRELADNVDFNAVGVRSVSFKLGQLGSIPWDISMGYYINTNNGIVGDSNSQGLSNSSVPQNTNVNNPTNRPVN